MSDENYRSASKSHCPGWNDPPKVTTNSPAVPTDHVIDQESMCNHMQTIFNSFVRRMVDGQQKQIQRRIDLIYESWANERLPDSLQKQLYSLACALRDGDVVHANVVHRSIICDHGKICSLWAPALRHLIFSLTDPDQEEHPENEIMNPS